MRCPRLAYPLLAASIFACYLPTLARSLTASDGPEIVTAAASLGVIHPTGYPLFTLIAHAFVRALPAFLAPCVRVELMNAMAGAGAALFTALAARALAHGDRAKDADLGGLFAGVTLGLSPLVWAEVRVPEVYALHLFLCAWAVWALCRFEVDDRPSWLVVAAIPMGLGLAHHVTMIYVVLAALLYVIARKPSFFVRKHVIFAAIAIALPIASYAYLLWAAAHTTAIAWGSPVDWDTLQRHVTAKQYQRYLALSGFAAHADRVHALPRVLAFALLPAGATLAVMGFFAIARRAVRPLILLVAVALANLAHGVYYAVPDHATYYLPALVPCAILAGVGLAGALRWARERGAWPGVIAAFAFAAQVPLALAKAPDLGRGEVDVETAAAEIADRAAPGSVLMTFGDGQVASMWYENHVEGRGRDVVTLDVGNLWTWWHQQYLASRYPASCDPLAGAFRDDRAAYERRCGTYAKRVALHEPAAWASLGLDAPPPGMVIELPSPFADRIVAGADPRCAEPAFRAAHALDDCRCAGYADRTGKRAEDCIYAAEEGGVVPRSPIETFVQRIIEDHVDERPVLERNVITRSGKRGEGGRGWDGPTFHRVSGDFALVNRGAMNQVIHAEDASFDACAGATLRRIAPRDPLPARPRPRPPDRRRTYRPNDAPTLIASTYLAADVGAREGDARRDFQAGEAIFLHLGWFERFAYDRAASDHRGAPIRHGVRVCVFDPAGNKVSTRVARSGRTDAMLILATTDATARGAYTVEACTVGEIGDATATPPERGCERTILEVELTVR